MDQWGSQSHDPWASGSPPAGDAFRAHDASAATADYDASSEFYRQRAVELSIENDKLKREIAFLRESLYIARRDHDLDYQLFLLRNKTPPPQLQFPTGKGYEAVSQKVQSSLQRVKKQTRKSPVVVEVMDDGNDSDKEIKDTLLRLLGESTAAALAEHK